jgi:hypothetical protein
MRRRIVVAADAYTPSGYTQLRLPSSRRRVPSPAARVHAPPGTRRLCRPVCTRRPGLTLALSARSGRAKPPDERRTPLRTMAAWTL